MLPKELPWWGALLRDPSRAPLILAVATLLALAPFLTRAFNIDEPLFVWAAEQIQRHPLDPYGFRVDWDTTVRPMSSITKNPPLAAYYLAGAAAVMGWSEVALHLAFVLPAMAVVLGTYFLARSWCTRPFLAALVTLTAPVFLLSGATVMCDTLMLAFWMWAIYCWREGIGTNRSGWLVLSGVLIAAAALTKYFAVSLIPLLAAYTLWKRRRVDAVLFPLLIPVLMLLVYDVIGRSLYGRSLLLDAGGYSGAVGHLVNMGVSRIGKVFIGLGFAGGGMIAPLLFLPLLKPSKVVRLTALVMVATGGAVVAFSIRPQYEMPGLAIPDASLILHWCVYGAAGFAGLWLAVADWRRNRDESVLLLLLWVAGTLVFACVINWSINGRSVLPLAPAMAILVARRLDWAEKGAVDGFTAVQLLTPVMVCGVIALAVTQSDASFANSARQAAGEIAAIQRDPASTLWFTGHWGFQFYLERSRAKCVNFSEVNYAVNDLMAVPGNNDNVNPPPGEAVTAVRTLTIRASSWVATENPQMYAGFYSSVYGPLPYSWGMAPAETYQVVRFKLPVRGQMR